MAKPVTEKEMNKSFMAVLCSVIWAIVAISATAGAFVAHLGFFMNVAAVMNLISSGFGIYLLNTKVNQDIEKEKE